MEFVCLFVLFTRFLSRTSIALRVRGRGLLSTLLREMPYKVSNYTLKLGLTFRCSSQFSGVCDFF